MQVLQDNFFYHSNPRLGADGDLQRERQLLAEQQKLCKAQARKLSRETNRRRKALDDRQRQWEMQEQRQREDILQQRRQQMQDATERFQRAHLPPSERRRPSFQRNVKNLEDALEKIQDTSGPCSWQNPSFTSNTNISRSCTPSPKPPTAAKSSQRQALSAVEAYSKLLQEQSRAEEQQDHSPQGSHVSDSCNTESLSSKDSLENEDVGRRIQPSFPSFFLDSEKTQPDPRKQTDSYPASGLTSFSGMLLLGDASAPSRKLFEPKLKKQEDSQWPDVPKATWEFTSAQKPPKTEIRPAPSSCNILALCEILSGDPEHFKTNSPRDSPRDNSNVPDRDTVNSTAFDSCGQKEAVLELKNRDVRLLKYPSATETPLHAKNSISKDALLESPSKLNIFFNESTTDNMLKEGTPHQQDKHFLSPHKEPSINNLNKVSNAQAKSEKPLNAAPLQHSCLLHVQSHKCHESPAEEAQKTSDAAPRSVREVRFLKGILKKQSEYVARNAPYAFGSGHLLFAKQVALAIRDSVEVTRAKSKETEGSNAVKKKVRWFDEVHVEKEAKEQNAMRHVRGKSVKSNAEDHQPSLSTVCGAPKPGPGVTPAAAAGYRFTREAWADVGVQEHSAEVKMPRGNTRPGGPRVPRRERSAREGAGPVSSGTRKGTVMRPQSATEVSGIAKTQGRMMTPRPPPPRVEAAAEKMACVAKTPRGPDLTRINCKPSPAAEQTLHRRNSDVYFPPHTCYANATTDCSAMKSSPGSGHPDSRRRCSETGLRLDCTPTDEEISQLWNGVRSALVDGKPSLRKQAPESGRALRKPCAQPCPQPPGSAKRRLLQTAQPTKQNAQLTRGLANNLHTGFESAAQFYLAEVQAEGLLKQRNTVAARETAQTQRSGRQLGLTNISMEEQKILLSLERLDHQLHCVQQYAGGNSTSHGPVLIDPSYTGEMKVNLSKRSASSANSRHRYAKKF